jgi:hypothetical protein
MTTDRSEIGRDHHESENLYIISGEKAPSSSSDDKDDTGGGKDGEEHGHNEGTPSGRKGQSMSRDN